MPDATEIKRYWSPHSLRACDPDKLATSEDLVLFTTHLADKTAALAAQAEGHRAELHVHRTDYEEKIEKDLQNYMDSLRAHKSQHAQELETQAEEHRDTLVSECAQLRTSYIEEISFINAQHAKELAEARGEGEPVLIHYQDDAALIGEPCMIHRAFQPSMDSIVTHAHNCGVKLYITHSMRRLNQKLVGAIVEQAERSNHHAGSAVDLNVVCDGDWFNSKRLGSLKIWEMGAGYPVRDFLLAVREDPDLRWGGDFAHKDSVHFDSDLARRNTDEWSLRVAQLGEEK